MSGPADPSGSGNRPQRFTLPDPEDRNVSAAERLTRAVICLLVENGTALLADALKPEDVAGRAGKSRASYYRTEGFPASEALNHEARLAVLERTLAGVLESSAADLEQVLGGISGYLSEGWAGESPREFVRQVSEANFDEMQHYASVLQLLAGALAPSSNPMQAALGGYYRTVTRAYGAAYEELFAFWRYRVHPSLTFDKFASILMALAEGLMLRSLGDTSVDRELFGEMISLVSESLTMADGAVPDSALPPAHDLPGKVAPPTRASIIAALLRLFESERAAPPTLGELAAAAGCAPTTISVQFGGVVGVIRAAWDEWIPEFHEIVERRRQGQRSAAPLTLLYQACLAVAIRAAREPALTRALLMSEIGVDPLGAAHRPRPIAELFEQLLTEASRSGDFRPPAAGLVSDAQRNALFAQALRTSILNIVVSTSQREGMSPADHAQWCVDYCWALLMPPRQSGS